MDRLVILGNGVDWCELSLKGLCKISGVSLINYKMPIHNKIARKIAHLHYSQKINSVIKLPLKKIWYRKIYKQLKFDKTDRNCLLIFDHNDIGGDDKFLKYIRQQVPNVVMAYIFTNYVRGSAALAKGYLENLSNIYDLVFAFDPLDKERFNFLYSPLIYDADDMVIINKNDNTNKAFYIGQAKDRLPILLSIYERLHSMGIDTDFNIVNVSQDKMKYQNDIKYNKPLTYRDVLQRISESTCLIDGIQGGSSGLTIKVCEAVCYHKKIITTNKHLSEYGFYDPRYMLIIEKADDITDEFLEKNKDVKYSDDAVYFFSGKRFWNQLWSEINNLGNNR